MQVSVSELRGQELNQAVVLAMAKDAQGPFYVWSDGVSNNVTDDLVEASAWCQQFRDGGSDVVYIVDVDGNEIDEIVFDAATNLYDSSILIAKKRISTLWKEDENTWWGTVGNPMSESAMGQTGGSFVEAGLRAFVVSQLGDQIKIKKQVQRNLYAND